MKVIIDANILFSSLIKNSLTANLLFKEDLTLYVPDFFIEEFMKYEKLILKKTNRSRGDYIRILHCLKTIIHKIPEEKFSNFLNKAEKICPDEKDIPYFALALKLEMPIWSNDKKLKEQNIIKIYSTKEMLEILK